MNPDEDAVIIRNHNHLRKQIMALFAINRDGHWYVRRDRVLSLLQLVELDTAKPQRSPSKIHIEV